MSRMFTSQINRKLLDEMVEEEEEDLFWCDSTQISKYFLGGTTKKCLILLYEL